MRIIFPRLLTKVSGAGGAEMTEQIWLSGVMLGCFKHTKVGVQEDFTAQNKFAVRGADEGRVIIHFGVIRWDELLRPTAWTSVWSRVFSAELLRSLRFQV